MRFNENIFAFKTKIFMFKKKKKKMVIENYCV